MAVHLKLTKNLPEHHRNSRFGTDFQKNLLCSYTKIRIASCRNREVIRGGADANSTETDYMYMGNGFFFPKYFL